MEGSIDTRLQAMIHIGRQASLETSVHDRTQHASYYRAAYTIKGLLEVAQTVPALRAVAA
ncbi:MAG: hypothetical protein ACTHM1_04130 [Solirubrobacteraceae bacterium]